MSFIFEINYQLNRSFVQEFVHWSCYLQKKVSNWRLIRFFIFLSKTKPYCCKFWFREALLKLKRNCIQPSGSSRISTQFSLTALHCADCWKKRNRSSLYILGGSFLVEINLFRLRFVWLICSIQLTYYWAQVL